MLVSEATTALRQEVGNDAQPKQPAFDCLCLVLALLVLVGAIALCVPNFLAIGFVFEQNYNEGWNVYNTQRLINHEIIYDSYFWRVNNYPIISFLINALINPFVRDVLIGGRVIALLSLTAVGLLAAAATRQLGGDRTDAVVGTGCALGFCYLVAPAWIMVDDPQTLGEAVMLGGFVTYLSGSPTRRRILLTALLVVLAGFIKHNLVAIPLAITFDLAVRSPRRLLLWLLCCTVFVAGFLGLTHAVAGGDFIGHLRSPRVFSWHGVRYHLMKYLRLFKFPLITLVLMSPIVFARRRQVLAVWGIGSIAAAAIFGGFEGASYNMFQDAAVFLGITVGVAFCELRTRFAGIALIRWWFALIVSGVVTFILAQPILARTPEAFRQFYRAADLLNFDRKAEATFLQEAQYISARLPAICESLLLCYTAGQPFILDPFNSRQYILAGKLDQDELIQRIAAHEFGVIQLRADICDDPAVSWCHILHYPQKFNRFTDDTLYAIARYYKIGERSQDGTFYVPN